ncbi:hypothetical protein AOQ84DRAFT_374704, partial [Glonium stellatum]
EERGLVERADRAVLESFPRLRDQPSRPFAASSSAAAGAGAGAGGGGGDGAQAAMTPFRLYRLMVPPTQLGTRSIAFAGMLTNITTAITASTQALWISAFFDGELDRLAAGEEEARWEAVKAACWGRWRYPCGYGGRVPDFVFDAVPYMDMLLKDLGLRNRRKGGWREVLEPYGVEDYRGLVGEWKGKRKSS